MSPFAALFVYSIGMITLPIGAFFTTKWFAEKFVVQEPRDANMYAVVGSVLTVHIILFAYIYKAFQEDKIISDDKMTKNDGKKD